MTNKNLRILAHEWFDKAAEDFGVAEHLLNEKAFPSPICFHAHQSAEKYLKGFLVFHNIDIRDEFKTHNLEKLHDYARGADPTLNDEVKESCFILNRYYIGARYPADMPDYPWKDVQEAVRAARAVQESILRLAHF